ncbi:CAP domain-containing protein [Sporosarcina aquimarina]|uniref:CAP domain-containing protein n=1 Tax=Sporosarcina aquimarina TaxID=114975 RepID=A0ABU4FXX3_9BACL|nr:CAP domain-containing protein [Sporosarcina aquimarina]MDW0109573.1 CAP domain-containing protein [Sporosarcina aquimarina]
MKKSMSVILLGSALILPTASHAEASTFDSVQTKTAVRTITVESNLHNLSAQLPNNQEELQASYSEFYKWFMSHYVKPQEKPVQKPEQKPDTPVEKPDPTPTPEEKPAKPIEKPTPPATQTPAPTPQPEQKPDVTPVPTPPAKPAPQEKPDQPADQGQVSASEIEQAVFTLTNAERQKAGLNPLKMDAKLMQSARQKSADMASKNYFSHTSPTYGSPFDQMKANGITYRAAAENIAMGQRSAEEVVKGWMNSPGHRENILTPGFTHIGIGYDANGKYWTQQFIQK